LLSFQLTFFYFLLDLRWNNIGYIGGQALADAMKMNYFLGYLEVAGNGVPEEIMTAIGRFNF
jgi:hypothetical protein